MNAKAEALSNGGTIEDNGGRMPCIPFLCPSEYIIVSFGIIIDQVSSAI
jgi:hypothetical protein